MAVYKLFFKKSVQKDFDAIPKKVLKKILNRIKALSKALDPSNPLIHYSFSTPSKGAGNPQDLVIGSYSLQHCPKRVFPQCDHSLFPRDFCYRVDGGFLTNGLPDFFRYGKYFKNAGPSLIACFAALNAAFSPFQLDFVSVFSQVEPQA